MIKYKGWVLLMKIETNLHNISSFKKQNFPTLVIMRILGIKLVQIWKLRIIPKSKN